MEYTGTIASISFVNVCIHVDGKQLVFSHTLLAKYGDPTLYDGGFQKGDRVKITLTEDGFATALARLPVSMR